MQIKIKEKFQNDFTTREAGERLRKMILEANTEVVLDFDSIKIASASFFDEGVAKLAFEGWDSEKINSTLTFLNLFNRDRELLISVCRVREIDLKFK